MKVSLYVRDEVWKKFRRTVLRRTGGTRALSSEVQSLIKDSRLEDTLVSGFERMKISPRPITSSQVVAVRPSIPTSAQSAVRETREKRH